MLLGEEARTLVAAVLLVGEHDEEEVAGQRNLLPLRSQERVHEHRDAALMSRAPRPHTYLSTSRPLERRMRPALAAGDDVDVPLEEKRRGGAAVEPSDEVRSAGNVRTSVPATRRLEQAADELDARGLVAGRVRRVEPDQRLRQLDDVHASSSSAASSLSTSSCVL